MNRLSIKAITVFIIGLSIVISFIAWRYIFQTGLAQNPKNELVVGTASAYAPYVSLNEHGTYEGFDIDIAQEIATRMGKKLVLKDLGSMTSLLIALKQNKIDCALWGISITPERQKEYELIHYQGKEINALPLIFWKEIPKNMSSIQDLKKFSQCPIVAEPGSSNEAFLRQFDFINLKPMEKIADALLDIKYGKSLATMIDPSIIDEIRIQYPDIQILWIPLPESWCILGNGIGLNKKNSVLITKVGSIISRMKKDGSISRLEKKWNMRG